MTEVKPCPFCGGPGRIEKSPLSNLSWPAWTHKFQCPMNAAVMYPNREEALKAGNARSESRAVVEITRKIACGLRQITSTISESTLFADREVQEWQDRINGFAAELGAEDVTDE